MTLRRLLPVAVAAAALVVAVPSALAAMGSPHASHRAPRTRSDPGGPTRPGGSQGTYAAATSHPIADPYYPKIGTTTLDALHYGLDLTWDAGAATLSGRETLAFRTTRAESGVALDLGAPLRVSTISLDHRPLTSWRHRGHRLTIQAGALRAGSRHTLVIDYGGAPQSYPAPTQRSDIPDLGWTVQPDGEAWALQEPYGAFTWYPVNDHPSDKAFYDITWHTRKAWTGVSNGQLVRDDVVGDQRVTTWHLGAPAASYLVTADIGPYRAYHQTGPHGLPLTYWVRPKDARVLPTLRQSPAMLRWLEARLGRFPFSSLGDVVAPTTSGEETETMVTIGPSILRSASGRADLLHEYSHQWYGDEVTPNNWKDLWMNESFATYIQIRWQASHGEHSLAFWRKYLGEIDQPLRSEFGPPGKYRRNSFAEGNVYYCGALMLDRLDTMLGQALFAKVLRGWPHQERFRSVDRGQWIAYLDRTTGRHLDAFVTAWLTDKKTPTPG